jgi:hypothetical protein
VSGELRISSTTSSMLSTAIFRPSRMCSRASAWSQVVLRAPHHDLVTVIQEVLDHLAQVHDLRHAVHQRQHDHAERGLQLRVLVQLVQHDLRDRVALQLDDDADAVAVRLVAQVRDLRQLLLAHQPAICSIMRDLFTMNGISVTMMRGLPLSGSSMSPSPA